MERLKVIDFESFRPTLTEGMKKERKSSAGRHPFDNVMMFKVLVLQRLFNLSDDQTEYPDKYMKYVSGMRFAAHVSFF